MMAPEPLRSATTSRAVDDTSLALPSDNKLRSGQQRVLDQVHTIKRSKSKQGTKNGSLSHSPTSLTTNEYISFKFSPSKANGTFSRFNSSMSTGFNKAYNTQRSRTLSSKAVGSRHVSTSGTWEQQINACTWPISPNGLKSSRSDPALAPVFSPAPAPAPAPAPSQIMRAKGQTVSNQHMYQSRANRQSIHSMTNGSQMTSSQTRILRPPSAQSHTEGRMGTLKVSRLEQQSAVNSMVTMSDLTLKEAVEYLSHPDDNYQQCGATFIQHSTYKEEHTKQEVFLHGGIPVLVTLLRSPTPAVSQAAAGALRNLVFKHQDNKLAVQHCGGIAKALQLLKETDSTETQKQVTGLLWNLSSADELKGELIATAMPALTENVVVPFTCFSDNCANNNIHPDVFYSTTGCLRNLSCAQKAPRQEMRECPGLIDSLMGYVQSCVAENNPDDKSVENCTCILHNLTYQLEAEAPQCFAHFYQGTNSQNGSKKNSTVGCFSPKSTKVEKEKLFAMAKGVPENSNASGVQWLSHTRAMQTYLSLLGSSENAATLEASCGALQNLTAGNELGSSVMSQILVQKLGAMQYIPSLLKNHNQKLQKTGMSLLGNMSRTSGLQTSMAKQILPELTNLLSSNPREMGNCDETIATACNTTRSLMLADTDVAKKVLTPELANSLGDLSENESLPKGSKAASMLLYSLWNDKNLQGVVKKLGLAKSLFVNENTTAAFKSLQVID